MGIGLNLIPTIIETVRLHQLSGSLLMLGRQDVGATREGFNRVLSKEKFSTSSLASEWCEVNEQISAESFFGDLGFSRIESLDISDVEGAQIIFDLNEPKTPADLVDRYDVLFDGGTLEHVFHLPNGLARCTEMLKSNGSFVHIGPMNNYVDHGFYQFSPTLWFDWFATNGWAILESIMVRLPSTQRSESPGWSFSFLPADRLGTVGQLDDAPYMHYFVARKSPGAVGDRIPVQAYYAKRYAAESYRTPSARSFSAYLVADGIRRSSD